MLKLRFKNNQHNSVWLVEPKVIIGRAGDCGLQVDQEGVEDHHLQILVQQEVIKLQPLVVSNVLRLNGKPVEETQIQTLNVNDVLTLGSVELEIIDPKVGRPDPVPLKEPQAESTAWALKANHVALSNRIFTLKTVMTVGRSDECDISLAAAHLSRRHAKLFVNDGLLYVKDLESSNGTFLNGERITEARVKRGDELRFDALSFGVIGPTDEIDKTTMRKVSRPQAATKPLGKHHTSHETTNGEGNSGARLRGTATRGSTKSTEQGSENVTSYQPGDKRGGWGLIIVTAVAVLVGVGLAFFMD